MGLAASQARLLSITARLSDNEMHSQQIANAKINLAGKTQDASREYINSLDAQKLVYTMYDAKGKSTNINLTPATMYSYSALKNQYGISNNAGQLLISAADAANYRTSANLDEFLAHYCDDGMRSVNPIYTSLLEQVAEYETKKQSYTDSYYEAAKKLNEMADIINGKDDNNDGILDAKFYNASDFNSKLFDVQNDGTVAFNNKVEKSDGSETDTIGYVNTEIIPYVSKKIQTRLSTLKSESASKAKQISDKTATLNSLVKPSYESGSYIDQYNTVVNSNISKSSFKNDAKYVISDELINMTRPVQPDQNIIKRIVLKKYGLQEVPDDPIKLSDKIDTVGICDARKALSSDYEQLTNVEAVPKGYSVNGTYYVTNEDAQTILASAYRSETLFYIKQTDHESPADMKLFKVAYDNEQKAYSFQPFATANGTGVVPYNKPGSYVWRTGETKFLNSNTPDYRQLIVDILGQTTINLQDEDGNPYTKQLIGYKGQSDCLYNTSYAQNEEPEIYKTARNSSQYVDKKSDMEKRFTMSFDVDGATVSARYKGIDNLQFDLIQFLCSDDTRNLKEIKKYYNDVTQRATYNDAFDEGSTEYFDLYQYYTFKKDGYDYYFVENSPYSSFLNLLDELNTIEIDVSDEIQKEYDRVNEIYTQNLDNFEITYKRYLCNLYYGTTYTSNDDFKRDMSDSSKDAYIFRSGNMKKSERAPINADISQYQSYIKSLQDIGVGKTDDINALTSFNLNLNYWVQQKFINTSDNNSAIETLKTYYDDYIEYQCNNDEIVGISIKSPDISIENGIGTFTKNTNVMYIMTELFNMAVGGYATIKAGQESEISDLNTDKAKIDAQITCLNDYDKYLAQLNDAEYALNALETFKVTLDKDLDVVPKEIFDGRNTEVAWYTNLWHRINGESDQNVNCDASGKLLATSLTSTYGKYWKILDDNKYTSQDWLKYALEQGQVTLEQVQMTEDAEDETGLKNAKWMSKIYSSCVDIHFVDDEAAIARAEAIYTQKLNEIEAEDKKLDSDIKKLDTQHSALKTEYDSIKELIGKNTERSFKAFS